MDKGCCVVSATDPLRPYSLFSRHGRNLGFLDRSWPPLWSSGQSSWLQIWRPGFDSRHYKIFWKKKTVVGLERGPLSLVNTTEELLGRKSSGSCLENREYGRRNPSPWPRGTLYPHKLAITSPTSGGRSVGIVRSRTQIMELDRSYKHSNAKRCSQMRHQTYTRLHDVTSPKILLVFLTAVRSSNITTAYTFCYIAFVTDLGACLQRCVADLMTLHTSHWSQSMLNTHYNDSCL
jgi:hypothetical protein